MFSQTQIVKQELINVTEFCKLKNIIQIQKNNRIILLVL